MSYHHQANKYSQNTAGEVKKKTTPASHSESVNHFYDAADQKQPAKDQRGSEAGCRHHVESDRSQNHHQDPQNEYPTPLRTKDFQPKQQPMRNHRSSKSERETSLADCARIDSHFTPPII